MYVWLLVLLCAAGLEWGLISLMSGGMWYAVLHGTGTESLRVRDTDTRVRRQRFAAVAVHVLWFSRCTPAASPMGHARAAGLPLPYRLPRRPRITSSYSSCLQHRMQVMLASMPPLAPGAIYAISAFASNKGSWPPTVRVSYTSRLSPAHTQHPAQSVSYLRVLRWWDLQTAHSWCHLKMNG